MSKYKEYMKQWFIDHPEAKSKYYKTMVAKYPWINAFYSATCRSKKKNIPFDLTKEWAAETYTGKCVLTGIEFAPSIFKYNSLSPTIDRINPEGGYIQGNCRWVLFCINSFKGTLTDKEMFRIARLLLKRAK